MSDFSVFQMDASATAYPYFATRTINHSAKPQRIERGERIAQLVITPYLAVEFAEADTLEDTARGEGGFGSTGSK